MAPPSCFAYANAYAVLPEHVGPKITWYTNGMFKLGIFLIIVTVIIGISTGAITIQVDQSKLNELPKTVLSVVKNQSIASQATYYLTMWKRKAELAIANSTEKKFELDMKYVRIDTANLKAALDANANPADIIVKSKLINESIQRAKRGAEEVSDEVIAKLRDAWLKILAAADQQIARLSSLAEEYKKYQEELKKLAPSPSVSPTPSALPLKF